MRQKRKVIADPSASAVDGSCPGGTVQDIVKEELSCTLDPSSIQFGIARWRRVFKNIQDYRLSSAEARFEFNHTKALRTELEELIKQEQICCAHVSWSLDVTPDQLILTLVADSEALKPIVNAFMPQTNIEADPEEEQ